MRLCEAGDFSATWGKHLSQCFTHVLFASIGIAIALTAVVYRRWRSICNCVRSSSDTHATKIRRRDDGVNQAKNYDYNELKNPLNVRRDGGINSALNVDERKSIGVEYSSQGSMAYPPDSDTAERPHKPTRLPHLSLSGPQLLVWLLCGSLPLVGCILGSKSGGGLQFMQGIVAEDGSTLGFSLLHTGAWLLFTWNASSMDSSESHTELNANLVLEFSFLGFWLAVGIYNIVWELEVGGSQNSQGGDNGHDDQGHQSLNSPRFILLAIQALLYATICVWRLSQHVTRCLCPTRSGGRIFGGYERISDDHLGDLEGEGGAPRNGARIRLDEKGSGLLAKLMFWWANPIFTAGMKRSIEPEDLPPLNEEDRIERNLKIFKLHWQDLERCYPGNSNTRLRFAWALWRTTRATYLLSTLMTFLMAACSLSKPLLLQHLITHLSREDDNTRHSSALGGGLGIGGVKESLTLATLLFIASALDWIFDLHAWRLKQQLGMRARGITITLLYEKILVMSSSSKSKLTDGKIVNTMSTDCNRIEWVYYFSDFLTSSVFLFVGILALLYLMFGWSAIVGSSVTLIGMPIMTWLGRKQASFTRRKLVDTDERLDLTRQMIFNMRVVKFYTWEAYFRDRIEEVRSRELSKVKWIKYIGALIGMIGQSLPTLMALTCFAAFTALQGGTLVAADAIASMALFNMLKNPFFVIPRAIRTIMEALVSLERVAEILDADEIEVPTVRAAAANGEPREAKENAVTESPRGSQSSPPPPTSLFPGEIRISGQTFYFAKDAKAPAMENAHIHVRPGQLCMCLGPFGSGKSFLLSAIMGEVFYSDPGAGPKGPRKACSSFYGFRHASEAKSAVSGSGVTALGQSSSRLAYVPQTAWVLNATIRENILFGSPYDKKKYKEIVVACALVKDLESLKAGDLTEIGERGVTLSGGQKQRISIARAVYKFDEVDIFLFDDPLSALDAHVTDWIFKRVILGLLKDKTRVLVTHQVHYAVNADQVIVMKSNAKTERERAAGETCKNTSKSTGENISKKTSGKSSNGITSMPETDAKEEAKEGNTGESNAETMQIWISEAGEYEELLRSHPNGDFAKLMASASVRGPMSARDGKREPITRGRRDGEMAENPKDRYENDDDRPVDVDILEMHMIDDDDGSGSLSIPILKRQTSEEARAVFEAVQKKAERNLKQGELVEEENRAEGAVALSVYLDYLSKGGKWSWTVVLIATVLILVCYRLSDLWVTRWTSGSNNSSVSSNMYYLSVYAALTAATLLTAFMSGLGMAYLSIVSSKQVHASLLRNLQKAPMAFFDSNPTGRVTNRFSRDIDAIDQNLTAEIYWFMRTLFQALTMVLVIAITIIYFCIILVPLGVLYWYLMQYYRGASRDVKRIDSTSKSPIFNHFSASLEGLPSIRAFAQAGRFKRIIVEITERNMQAFYMSTTIGVWLPMQLAILGTFLQFIIVIMCIGLRLEPALAGLCISYGSSFCLWLQSTIQALTSLERSMNAVERTKEYSMVTPEGIKWLPVETGTDRKWPSRGGIKFQGCSMRYRGNLPLVLNSIHLEVEPNMKVGICGRTGAGKSSLVALLMRLCEAEDQGMVFVDDLDISSVPLQTLRSRIGVIPQDPIVFPATIKANLDPYQEASEAEILETLEKVHLGDWVDKVGGLDYEISSSSDEMSLGQKQLLCMARVLLSRPKILILDEATASIDYRTDQLIQKMVTEEFKDVTVLTIAHRIDTIIHYDRILVLDRGQVAEFGSPEELLKNGGIFASLIQESREARKKSVT